MRDDPREPEENLIFDLLVYRCLMRVKDRETDLGVNMRNTLARLKVAAERAASK